MPKHVVILGGGVAGMSAAHELIERNFKVTILERRKELPGGKARSIPIKDTATDGRSPLPGEHGFRFFPGFYHHIIDTMERTPFTNPFTGRLQPRGVADNLVNAPVMMMAVYDKPPIKAPNGFPKSFKQLKLLLKAAFNSDHGLSKKETKAIIDTIWQLMSSCRSRREIEYEQIGWEDFTRADQFSEKYRMLFVEGLTRTLVAAKADTANTRTNGNILLQMLFSFTRPFEISDRILNAPTNEAWLTPWYQYLIDSKVDYHFNSKVKQLLTEDGKIKSVVYTQGEEKKSLEADYFLSAVPVERFNEILEASQPVITLDPQLAHIKKLSTQVAWMNGIQFFLKSDVKINEGHILMVQTPWALTAISQAQFWKPIVFNETYGDGQTHGVLSVDISDWDTPGEICPKIAKECTKLEVVEETWHQLKKSINTQEELLKDENLSFIFLDDSITDGTKFINKEFEDDSSWFDKVAYDPNKTLENEEPLLVNHIDSWKLRSESHSSIPNLFMASDYVRTNTNLATMEAANEAARRAVNDILKRSNTKSKPCRIWKFKEPIWTLYYKWVDHRRFKKGEGWKKVKITWYAYIMSLILWILGYRKIL